MYKENCTTCGLFSLHHLKTILEWTFLSLAPQASSQPRGWSPLSLLLGHLLPSEQAGGTPRVILDHVVAAGHILLRLPEAAALALIRGCLDDVADREGEKDSRPPNTAPSPGSRGTALSVARGAALALSQGLRTPGAGEVVF